MSTKKLLKKLLSIMIVFSMFSSFQLSNVFAEAVSLADAPDDSGNAMVIDVNKEYKASIKSGDYDWYKFVATEHTYVIYLNRESEEGFLRYNLYDSGFSEVTGSGYISTNHASEILRLSKNKVYYLKISADTGNPDYTFSVYEYQYPDKVAYSQYIKNDSEYSTFYGFNSESPEVFKSITPNVSFGNNEVTCIHNDSYITFEMNNPIKNIDKISEIIIRSIKPENFGYGYADIYISADTETWKNLEGVYNYNGSKKFDIGEEKNIKYIRLVGTSKTPFNLLSVEVCTGTQHTESNQTFDNSVIPEGDSNVVVDSVDVSPKSGFSNYTDNDKTGIPFQFAVDTSTNVEDIYVLTETGWKITSDNFEYINHNDYNGKRLWTFEMYMNSPGNRTFEIYGVDASGNVSNSATVQFEVVAHNVEKLATPVVTIDNKSTAGDVTRHKSDNLILKWDKVEGADKYAVFIWGVNNDNAVYEGYSTTYQIDKSIVDYAQYAVSVYAMSESQAYSQSDAATFNLTLTPKLEVTSNAESFKKNKTLIAPATCVSQTTPMCACTDVYVNCEVDNWTISWVDVNTGKTDMSWCKGGKRASNPNVIESWIVQNNQGKQRSIAVTITAENTSYTYWILQEKGDISAYAMNSIDYEKVIHQNGLDTQRIEALKRAEQYVYYRWIAPIQIDVWKNNKTCAVGEKEKTYSYMKDKTYQGIPYSMATENGTNKITINKFEDLLTKAENNAISNMDRQGIDCTSFGGYVTYGDMKNIITTSYFSNNSKIHSRGEYTFYGMKDEISYKGNVLWKRYTNVPNSENDWKLYESHPEDIYVNLKPGDVVVYRGKHDVYGAGGHMRVFVGRENGLYYFYEATVSGTSNCQLIQYTAKQLWDNGYQPFYSSKYND